MEAGIKTILITGCNKGVGFGILKTLAAQPEKHNFIMAVRSIDNGKKALSEIIKQVPDFEKRATILELDISKSESIDKFVKHMEDTKTKIHCLVNNAGMAFKGDIFNEEVVRVTFATNFYGTVEFTEKMLSHLHDGGKIVFITSSVGKLGKLKSEELVKKFDDPKITREGIFALAKQFYDEVVSNTFEKNGWPRAGYVISKLCLNIYTRWISQKPDIVKRGIQVYACCPGWVRTDMAGPKAERSIEEGAVCPCYLVNLPYKINPEFQGKFFYDSKVTPL